MAVTSREQSHTEQKLLGITDRIDQAYKLRDGGMEVPVLHMKSYYKLDHLITNAYQRWVQTDSDWLPGHRSIKAAWLLMSMFRWMSYEKK